MITLFDTNSLQEDFRGTEQMSVTLTEAAASEIKRVMSEQNRPELKYVRVGVAGGQVAEGPLRHRRGIGAPDPDAGRPA